MKLPKSFECGPHKVRVERVSHLLPDSFGEFDYNQMRTRIDTGAANEVQIETVHHELVEAINAIYELDLPHRTIQILGAAFTQYLKTVRY